MEYIKGFLDLEFHKDTAVTVGKFEGIHRGHEFLVEKIVSNAKSNDRESVLICFDKSPRYSFGSNEEKQLKSLITNEERAYVLENAGLDYIVELPFTEEVKSMEPEAFLSYLTEPEQNANYVIGTGRLPAVNSVYELPSYRNFLAADTALDTASSAADAFFFTARTERQEEMHGRLAQALEEALPGEADAEEVIQTLRTAVHGGEE